MLKSIAAITLSVAFAAGCATTHKAAIHLDASSAEAAEASYRAMMEDRSPADKQQLALAVLKLNMEGVKNAYEVVGNPELQSLSIARVRDKVAGMTAEQIIDRAKKVTDVRVEPAGQ